MFEIPEMFFSIFELLTAFGRRYQFRANRLSVITIFRHDEYGKHVLSLIFLCLVLASDRDVNKKERFIIDITKHLMSPLIGHEHD